MLSEALKARRKETGLSIEAVTFRIREHLPEALWVTAETIRKYETGMVPEHKANLVILAALAKVYECKVSDLSESAAQDAQRILDLLESSSRCSLPLAG